MNPNRPYKRKTLTEPLNHRLRFSLNIVLKKVQSNWLIIALAGITAIAFLLIITIFSYKGVAPELLTRDIVSIAQLPAYFGMFSQIGLLLWAASAAICFFSANLLARQGQNSRLYRFLLMSGWLTLLIGLDDVFLLHEDIFPRRGIPEIFVVGVYGICALLYLFKFSKLIFKTEYVLFLLALCFFAVSLLLDIILPSDFHYVVFEDGAKLLGIVFWTTYFCRTAFSLSSPPSTSGT